MIKAQLAGITAATVATVASGSNPASPHALTTRTMMMEVVIHAKDGGALVRDHLGMRP